MERGAVAVGEGLRSLGTEPFAAEREWEAEGVPVLRAAARSEDTRLNSSHIH